MALQGNKHKVLQDLVNDRTLINALYGTSLPDSPSLRYKQQCFTRSYLERHGMTAEQARKVVHHMSAEQMFDTFADLDSYSATTQVTTAAYGNVKLQPFASVPMTLVGIVQCLLHVVTSTWCCFANDQNTSCWMLLSTSLSCM